MTAIDSKANRHFRFHAGPWIDQHNGEVGSR
jgi:hypothetical protein